MKNKLVKVLILVFSLCMMLSVATACGPQEKKHEHTFLSEWTSLGDYHWKAATCECDEKKDYQKHTLNEESICTVCNSIVTSRNGVYYEFSDDLTYAIAVASTETESEIVIEQEYLGVPVTAIADRAFSGSEVITSISIHSGITSIGERALHNCKVLNEINVAEENPAYKTIEGDLYSIDGKTIIQYAIGKQQEQVTLNDEVEKIANYAFWGCKTMTSVVVPDNVTAVGNYSFSYCSALNELQIGNGVKTIGHDAFYACGLESVTVPNNVISLGGCVFAWNTALKTASIGSGVVSAEDGWFRSCPSIQEIEVSSLNNAYCSKNGNLYTKDGKKLIQYTCASQAKEVVVSNGVEVIGAHAFAKSLNLVSVSLPDSVTEIGASAFAGCELLKDIVIPNSVTNIGANAFNACELIKKLVIPEKVESIGANAFDGCIGLSLFCEVDEAPNKWHADWNVFDCPVVWGHTASEGLEYDLRDDGYYEVYSLGSCGDADIVIPSYYKGKKVIAISDAAFDSCNMINSITIPNTVQFIGDRAFYDCASLVTMDIPNSVKSIGSSAFEGCSSLEKVFIDSSLELIGDNVFYRCKSLKAIDVDAENKNYKSIDGNLFTADEKTLIQYAPAKDGVSYTVPKGVETIEQMAFANCSKLTSIVIADSVKNIGEYAFYNCYSLIVLTIGSGIEELANTAFYDCYKLVEVYDKSKNVDDSYFANVLNVYTNAKGSKLSYSKDFIIYTEGAKKILVGYRGTQTELVVPNGVTEIGAYAFYNDQSIVSVTLSNSITSIGDNAFYDCNSLEKIVLGDKVSSIGVSAFEDCALLKDVLLNNALLSIGDKAFASCYSLESVVIPNAVKVMGAEAFSLCPKLNAIYCKAEKSWIENYASWAIDWNAKTDAQVYYGYVG